MINQDLQKEGFWRFNLNWRLAVFGFFLLGIFLLAVGGGLFLFRGSTGSDDIQIISSYSNDSIHQSEVIVHVDGAVVKPGVYRLAQDARVGDAISAAGGLAADADSSRINLAAKIADGQKIYVLARGEQSGSSVVGGSVAGQSVGSLININTASESELDKLPGIGPVTALKIISARPYNAPDELLSKKAVSKSTYEKIREMITF